jgi:hypothetical protein
MIMKNTKVTLMKNKKINGFSLVESIIAISLLASVAVLFTMFSTNRMVQIQGGQQKACTQASLDVIDKIRSVGVVKSVNSIANDRIARATAPEDAINFIAISDDWISANEALWETSGGATVLKNNKAIVGSMSLLNSLYNRNPLYCTDGVVYNNPNAQAQLIQNDSTGHLRNVNSRIRVQAISLIDGSLSCPGRPLVIRPAGVDINRSLTEQYLAPDVIPEPDSTANLGFYLTVRTEYTNSSNNRETCEASAVFNYPKMAPDSGDLTVPVPTITRDPQADCDRTASATVTIRGPGAPASNRFKTDKGIALVCRDASLYGGGNPPAGASCPSGPTRQEFTIDPELRRWVKCDEVTLCGVAPSNSATAETNMGYSLRYVGMSLGCNMAVEVRAVDVAHNLAENPTVGRSNQIPLPGCNPCQANYTGPGYCAPSVHADGCTYNPPPPADGDGDGGGDGGDCSPDGGAGDGDDGTNP